MSLEFVSRYSNDETTREHLYPLFEAVFEIPVDVLKDFHQRGFWDPTYRPYTLFDGERAVANASMFSMPLMIKGKQVQAAGIQSVMTHPEHRGKGYMKRLVAKMLEEIDQEFEAAFLQTGSPDLYTPFGFRVLEEHRFTAPLAHVPSQETQNLRKLDFSNEADVDIVRGLFENYQPLSQVFAPMDHSSSFYLNMYNPYYHEKLYYSEALHAVLVFEVDGETLRLFDVVAEKLPSLEAILAQIAVPCSQIEFSFSPDQFGITEYIATLVTTGNRLMVRGPVGLLPESFKLPITAAFRKNVSLLSQTYTC